ncbi:MAG: domain protein beta barrel domain protein [Phycisphaerales bacterium]|nr:domain protein beta barrel domain protein [Phycisphaerales bacterium]MDB5356726.1 domain protein beta barrel domain protein [Phycisphaerales bacterium]
MAHLERILIYPVKSLDGLSVPTIRVLASGALEGDRRFALMDSQKKYVNGKRNSRVHYLRSSFDAMTRTLHLRDAASRQCGSFDIDHDRPRLHAWLSEYFGIPVELEENPAAGFPDDTDSPGPTLISTATLHEVASWFPGLDADQMRKRLRANLEIGGVPPFWEDRLYGPAGVTRRFRIGSVEFAGVNPCQRCVVPPRDPNSGESYPEFAKIFARKREETLPPWAERSRFNHFYRLAINTLLPAGGGGKAICVGDEIRSS